MLILIGVCVFTSTTPSPPSLPPHRHPREGGDPAPFRRYNESESRWIPAFAGMTLRPVGGVIYNDVIYNDAN